MKEAIRRLAARPRRALGLAAHWWASCFDSTLGLPGEGYSPRVRGDPATSDTWSSLPAPGVHDAKGFVFTGPHRRLRRRLASRGRDKALVGAPPTTGSGSWDSLSPGISDYDRDKGLASSVSAATRPHHKGGPWWAGIRRKLTWEEWGGSPDGQPAPAGAGKRHLT
jgi:hypothetical protein